MTTRTRPIDRRRFLGSAVAAGAALGLGSTFWNSVFAEPAVPGPGPYGPLDGRLPDANGLVLPEGFTSRVIARTGAPVGSSEYVWPPAPDGQATFPTDDGGWILVTNSEWLAGSLLAAFGFDAALGAGVSAVRFSAAGDIVDAYRILADTNINCAGGPTPWGTWLSGEEYDLVDETAPPLPGLPFGAGAAGQLWECDPTGATPGVPLPALGVFSHEAAAVDPFDNRVYMTEDQGDGLLYRFTPTPTGNNRGRAAGRPPRGQRPDLSRGLLEVARVEQPDVVLGRSSKVRWLPVPDPSSDPVPTRRQVPDATVFRRGEGMWFDSGTVYFTTTADDRVWAYDTTSSRIEVVYDLATTPNPPLEDPDNVTVHAPSGDVFVAEDDGTLQLVLITAPNGPGSREAAPFMRFTPVPGVPHAGTEVTGPCFDPSGTRLYVSSQRGILTSTFPSPQAGITYEITGPFRTARR